MFEHLNFSSVWCILYFFLNFSLITSGRLQFLFFLTKRQIIRTVNGADFNICDDVTQVSELMLQTHDICSILVSTLWRVESWLYKTLLHSVKCSHTHTHAHTRQRTNEELLLWSERAGYACNVWSSVLQRPRCRCSAVELIDVIKW